YSRGFHSLKYKRRSSKTVCDKRVCRSLLPFEPCTRINIRLLSTSANFKFINSLRRRPELYNNLMIHLCFILLVLPIMDSTSSLEITVGSLDSFLGRSIS